MQIGLHALGIGAGANREVIETVSSSAESVGFATLWAGEHVIGAHESASKYPYSPDGRIAVAAEVAWNDPMITLSFAAAATSAIKLATGILLLPEHNPVTIAKQVATLDQLSRGRFILGVGIGWSREEFAALGVPFPGRAERTAEYVAAMRLLWREGIASFDGEFVKFDAIQVNPKPVNDSRVPILLGGNSDAALRRVAAWGDGWYGFNLDSVDDVAERIAFLSDRCVDQHRNVDELRLAVSLRDPQTRNKQALIDLGISELVLVDSPPDDPRAAGDWVATLADRWLN